MIRKLYCTKYIHSANQWISIHPLNNLTVLFISLFLNSLHIRVCIIYISFPILWLCSVFVHRPTAPQLYISFNKTIRLNFCEIIVRNSNWIFKYTFLKQTQIIYFVIKVRDYFCQIWLRTDIVYCHCWSLINIKSAWWKLEVLWAYLNSVYVNIDGEIRYIRLQRSSQ